MRDYIEPKQDALYRERVKKSYPFNPEVKRAVIEDWMRGVPRYLDDAPPPTTSLEKALAACLALGMAMFLGFMLGGGLSMWGTPPLPFSTFRSFFSFCSFPSLCLFLSFCKFEGPF